MPASGEFDAPGSGRFTRKDLTPQTGAASDVAKDAFFGTHLSWHAVKIVRNPVALAWQAQRRQPWLGRCVKGGAAAPELITHPAKVLIGGKRPYRGIVQILRGASRVGLADPLVRPAVIVRGYVPPAKRAVRQPIIVKGASRIGLADPLTKPAKVLIGGSHKNRGQVLQTRGARLTSPTDPRTKPTIVVKGQPKYHGGIITILRGAARIGLADEMVRPALIVRGPFPPGRAARKQPILVKGAARVGLADPRSNPARVLIGGSHRNRGIVAITRGPARIGIADELVRPALIVRGQPGKARYARIQPLISHGAKDVLVVTDRTRPAQIVSGLTRRKPGIVAILRGAARIGLADPLVRPALIVRGLVPPLRFARKQPILTRGAAKTSATDPRTHPILGIVTGSQKRRSNGQIVFVRGASRVGIADPLTRPIRIVKGQPKHTNGQTIFVRGAAKISVTDPRTRAATIILAKPPKPRVLQPLIAKHVKDTPVVTARVVLPLKSISAWQSKRRAVTLQPQIGRPARLGATDARLTMRPAMVVTAPNKRFRTSVILRSQGGARTSATDPRTRPMLAIFAPQPPHPWGQVIRTLGASPFSVPQTSFAYDIFGGLIERPPLYALITADRPGAVSIAMIARPSLIAGSVIDRPALYAVAAQGRGSLSSLIVLDRVGAASAAVAMRERLGLTGALSERAPSIVVALRDRPAIVALIAALRVSMISVSLTERPGLLVAMIERPALTALTTLERLPMIFVSLQER